MFLFNKICNHYGRNSCKPNSKIRFKIILTFLYEELYIFCMTHWTPQQGYSGLNSITLLNTLIR